MTSEEMSKFLLKEGFNQNQVDEIIEGQNEGFDVTVYAKKYFYAVQMREIRLGLEDGIDVSQYAKQEYDWFQMQEIRMGLVNKVNVSAYNNPAITYDRMRQVRLGLEQGVNLAKYVKLDAGILEQLRKAYAGKINILEYIKAGYSPDQLEEIRTSLEKGLDINKYITPELRGMAIRQIWEGLEDGLDVSVYARVDYDWRQMEEIKFGLENRVDVSWYTNTLYSWRQMRQIRLGLEAGIDVSVYKTLMYTPREMEKRRILLEKYASDPLHAILRENDKKQTKKTIFDDFKLEISKDGMEAFIHPRLPALKLKREEMQKAMREYSISRGIDNNALKKLEEGEGGKEPVRIAEGKPAREGEEGWYEYFFRTSVARTHKILEDGSVDYREVEWYETVKKDQKLAFYHDATDGTDGFTVTGSVIPGKRGREKKILIGHGFHVLEDGKTYISDLDGMINLEEERMEVSSVLVVPEVTLATGNVNFDGSVHVLGDVLSGTKIQASENVIVDGYVENATIECGGDVLMRKGMNARHASGKSGYVYARNVMGGFFELAKIHAESDIRADYCMNCELYSEGKIIITGATGSIMGGLSIAVRGIRADNIGNSAGIATKIRLGVNEGIINNQKEVQTQINGVNQELKILRNAYSEFTGKYKAEERNNNQMFLKVENAIYTKELELEELQNKKSEMEAEAKMLREVGIRVHEKLYEGVDIEINGAHWRSKEMENVSMKNVRGRILVNSNR
jgi:uncharacterized protein (DUF342 family)